MAFSPDPHSHISAFGPIRERASGFGPTYVSERGKTKNDGDAPQHGCVAVVGYWAWTRKVTSHRCECEWLLCCGGNSCRHSRGNAGVQRAGHDVVRGEVLFCELGNSTGRGDLHGRGDAA